MNIIDVIARVDPPCALVPPGLAPEEQTLQNWSTCKHGMYTNVYCWGTEFIQGFTWYTSTVTGLL